MLTSRTGLFRFSTLLHNEKLLRYVLKDYPRLDVYGILFLNVCLCMNLYMLRYNHQLTKHMLLKKEKTIETDLE